MTTKNNIKRFQKEIETREIEGGYNTLNEYQDVKLRIEILTRRLKDLEPYVLTYLETQPNERKQGYYGLTQVVETQESTRVSTKLTKEYFIRHDLDINEVSETTPSKRYLKSDLKLEVTE